MNVNDAHVGSITADAFEGMVENGARLELVNGVVRMMTPAGFQHGVVVARVTARLAQHVEQRGLGMVCGAETGFLLSRDPDTVRAPDVAFVRQDRIDAAGVTPQYWAGAPDLAGEVVSPRDSAEDVEEKVQAWLAAGCHVVWVLSPRRRAVTVYHRQRVDKLDGDAVLEAGADLAGFRVTVRDLFD